MKEEGSPKSINMLMSDDREEEDSRDDETVDTTLQGRCVNSRATRLVGQSPEASEESCNDEDCCYSPATQTLHVLSHSQQAAALHYDLSQLEYDVVKALVETKKTRVFVSARDELGQLDLFSHKCDDEDASSTLAISSQVNKKQRQETRGIVHGNRNMAKSKISSQPPDIVQKRGRIPDIERRNIQQIDLRTGKVVQTYQSFTEAGQVVGFSRHIVASILKGSYKTDSYKGWTFRYVDSETQSENDDDDGESHSQAEMDVTTRRTFNRIQQIDVATGKCMATFPSFMVAAEQTRMSRHKISAIVKGELDSFDGWTFQYEGAEREQRKRKGVVTNTESGQLREHSKSAPVDEIETEKCRFPLDVKRMPLNRAKCSGVAISVEELDSATGKVLHTYPSLSQASAKSGANRHIITDVLKGKVGSWRGKKWRYYRNEERNKEITASEPPDKQLQIDKHGTSRNDDRVQDEGKRKRHRYETPMEDSNWAKAAKTAIAAGVLDADKNEWDTKKVRRVSDDPSLPRDHHVCAEQNPKSNKVPVVDNNGSTQGEPLVFPSSIVNKETENLWHEDDASSLSTKDGTNETNECERKGDAVDDGPRGYELSSITIAQGGSLGVKINKIRTPDYLSFLRGHHY